MIRTLVMAAIALLIATAAQGDSIILLMGVGGAGGNPPANCGVGATDLTAGCTITVLLGLGP